MKRKAAALIIAALLAGTALPAILMQSASTKAAGPDSVPPPAVAAAASSTVLDGFTVEVNGQALALDVPPRLAGGTLLVPLRSIAEALGATVAYDGADGSITAAKDGSRVVLRPGDINAEKNGIAVQLAAVPVRDGDTVLVPLRFFAEAFGTSVKWDGNAKRVTAESENYLLPAVGSYAKLKELLAAAQGPDLVIGLTDRVSVQLNSSTADVAASSVEKRAEGGSSGNPDYSATNVQVEGVDEGDVVKTDGQFLYQVNGKRIIIARAVPGDQLALESVITLDDAAFGPQEIYVDGDRLTVIGTSRRQTDVQRSEASSAVDSMPAVEPMAKRLIAPGTTSTVKTLVYDISDRKAPKLMREVETEGSYVSSRRIGDVVYVIANRYLNRYAVMQETPGAPAAPSYRDSAARTGQWTEVQYGDIRYFPESLYSAYLVVAGINTASSETPVDVSVYLGSADNVFASADHLYAALPRRQVSQEQVKPMVKEEAEAATKLVKINVEETTEVYKFLLDDGKVRFSAKGSVPGTVLNQFSMDEHNGYFRIATTKGKEWSRAGEMLTNNVYVLNEEMGAAGQIEGIAPGESIYSVRFMGNRGYMVTFQKVDPLFVLDLSNPAAPSILGQLKIPGYSDYLHPYDENHLIGFGKDAVVVTDERYEK
ncbi:MAG: hypothetical protein K0Q90_3473, partial [Paenibacillaceae bacterium]|nr:hypothetical protein [Paenibacillaceae bacterium]